MRLSLPVAAAAAAILLLTGCSGGSSDQAGHHQRTEVTTQPTPSTAAPAGTVIRINITADAVDPNGSRVQVAKGKPVTLLITAAKAGTMHVHSSPERHIEYPKGTSSARLTFDQPGMIDIESHTLDKLIVQLEVR